MNLNKQSWERIREVFSEALYISKGNDRDAFLDSACGNETALKNEIKSLLNIHETPCALLKHDAAGQNLINSSNSVGSTIDQFHLVERIGEGGFAEFYRAEQESPSLKDVGIKIFKPYGSAHFEAEKQALARMNHPNIAQIYDSGFTESGRPYFVMELVYGTPLLRYCNECHLTLPQRIHLFQHVCHGVQHVHLKGFLHCDLKPANILVTVTNNEARPKIIDFGLAQSINKRHVDMLRNVLWGTPRYMSPEQLNEDVDHIDPRTDIYSLGVILYELLTGFTPMEGLLSPPLTISKIRMAINENQILPPSACLHGFDTKAKIIANERQTTPAVLEQTLRDHFDGIVMKALHTPPDSRYADVDELRRKLIKS